jgi:small subunit ribosomal protein S21
LHHTDSGNSLSRHDKYQAACGQAGLILLSAATIRDGCRREDRKVFTACPLESNRKTGLPVQVLVRDNNVDQALRALKKKMQREGIFREMKMRGHYEKPSEKRAREKAEAVRRARKLARKRAQREGLLPSTPRPVPGAGGPGGPGASAGAGGGGRPAR